MSVEVTANKGVDLLLGHGVHVLELVKCSKLLDVEAVGSDDVGLALEEMFGLESGDLGDGGEDVGGGGGGSFHAVAVVDAAVAGLLVEVELVEVVVEVAGAGAEIATE